MHFSVSSNCSGRRIVAVAAAAARDNKVLMDTCSVAGILRKRTVVSADTL